MFRLFGEFGPGDGHYDFSFRRTDLWTPPEKLNAKGRKAGTKIAFTSALFGDEERGPIALLIALDPDVAPPDTPAHSHASDNWRISLKGTLPIGRDIYGPGEFRFQQGWKPYARDNYAHGPDGGWMFLVFADRRGMRLRPVDRTIESPDETDRLLADFLGIKGDLLTADDSAASGPSALATNLGELRGAHLNGSIADAGQWPEVSAGVRGVVGVFGDVERGPVIFLAASDPGAPVIPADLAGSETLRLVLAGSCSIGDTVYEVGDLRLDEGPDPAPGGVAGNDGCTIATIVGDRRTYLSSSESDPFYAAVSEQLGRLDVSAPTG